MTCRPHLYSHKRFDRVLRWATATSPIRCDRKRLACKDITHAIGVTLFRERFFHADPHPGNIMFVGEELKPGLIDFGQCHDVDEAAVADGVSIGGTVTN